MKRTEVKPLRADITLGLNKLYSKEANSLQDLVVALTSSQLELQQLHHIQLSAKLTPCKIVFSGQDEDSATISFVNYPQAVHFSYHRYLINQIRKGAGLDKTPFRLIFRQRTGRNRHGPV